MRTIVMYVGYVGFWVASPSGCVANILEPSCFLESFNIRSCPCAGRSSQTTNAIVNLELPDVR